MSTVGDSLSTVRDVQYCGDILSTVGGVQYSGGCHDTFGEGGGGGVT